MRTAAHILPWSATCALWQMVWRDESTIVSNLGRLPFLGNERSDGN